MLTGDDELRAWLPTWRADGGDARRFRRGIAARFGGDEVAAWRHCEQALTPLRPRIRQLARALLVHPRHLPYQVAAAIADQRLERTGTRPGSRPASRAPPRRPRRPGPRR